MKNRIASGAAAIVFGLLISLGPQFLFKVCPVMGDMIMKCHWSAQAEITFPAITVISILLLIAAAFNTLYLARKKE
jgi:hypothetical protein